MNDKCEECGAEGEVLKHVVFEGPGSVVIVEQDLCEDCYVFADSFTMLNDIEVVNVVKEV